MDVEISTEKRDWTEGSAPKKRRKFHRGTPTEPYLGGFCPFHWNIFLGRPGMSPRRLMTSSRFIDILGDSRGSLTHVEDWRSSRRANVFSAREYSFTRKG